VGVEREVGNVMDKLTHLATYDVATRVREAAEALRVAKSEYQRALAASGGSAADVPKAPLLDAVAKVRMAVSQLSSSHRDLHSSVSKVGKAVDRHFVQDFDSTSREDVFTGRDQRRMLDEVVLQHFYRQGQLELGDALASEAGIDPADLTLSKEPFQELNGILDTLERRDLAPALLWVERNRRGLEDLWGASSATSATRGGGAPHRISLEMKLHKLQFVEFLLGGGPGGDPDCAPECRSRAVAYARRHFPRLTASSTPRYHYSKHEREVQSLMGAVMFAGRRLAVSPYAHLLDETLWHDAKDHFVRDACALMGLSVESSLAVAVNAGCSALPALLNIKQVMQQRQVAGVWNAKDELPIEIDLGADCRFHSIFACPILRQQTTDANPPLRLTCGHCISRDALNKLASGHKLKCPYCPVEQNPNDACQITF